MTTDEIILAIGIGCLAFAIVMDYRFRALQSKLLVSEEGKKDAEIEAKVHSLTDAELDSLSAKNLGAGADTKK